MLQSLLIGNCGTRNNLLVKLCCRYQLEGKNEVKHIATLSILHHAISSIYPATRAKSLKKRKLQKQKCLTFINYESASQFSFAKPPHGTRQHFKPPITINKINIYKNCISITCSPKSHKPLSDLHCAPMGGCPTF